MEDLISSVIAIGVSTSEKGVVSTEDIASAFESESAHSELNITVSGIFISGIVSSVITDSVIEIPDASGVSDIGEAVVAISVVSGSEKNSILPPISISGISLSLDVVSVAGVVTMRLAPSHVPELELEADPGPELEPEPEDSLLSSVIISIPRGSTSSVAFPKIKSKSPIN